MSPAQKRTFKVNVSDKAEFTLWDDNTGICHPQNHHVKNDGKECIAA